MQSFFWNLRFLNENMAIRERMAERSDIENRYHVDTGSGDCPPVGIPSGVIPSAVKLKVKSAV